MTCWFVSRHQGAVEWAASEGFAVDRLVSHIEVDEVQAGDTVIGTLPVSMVARLCSRGARYLHLTIEMRPDDRGRELTERDMRERGARLEAFEVRAVAAAPTSADGSPPEWPQGGAQQT